MIDTMDIATLAHLVMQRDRIWCIPNQINIIGLMHTKGVAVGDPNAIFVSYNLLGPNVNALLRLEVHRLMLRNIRREMWPSTFSRVMKALVKEYLDVHLLSFQRAKALTKRAIALY